MHQLSLEELDERSTEVEAAVDATPGIDRWCSGPDWIIPVNRGFAPVCDRLLLASPADDGFALFARYEGHDGDPILSGLEPLWGFGAPIVGATDTVDRAVATLATVDGWRTIVLPGVPPPDELRSTGADRGAVREPRPDSPTMATAIALSRLGRVGFAEGITRQVADLGDGYDAWLARRSQRFRRNLRKAAVAAERVGVAFTDVAAEPDLFARIMAIEHRSWKGREGSGITSLEMSTMYRLMIDRLAARGRLLAHVATIDGEDVGYILGGLRARRYRGLQISYVDDAPIEHLSIGNLLQDHQLRLLDADHLADAYDLGMDFDYKRRWADRAETSLTIVVHRG